MKSTIADIFGKEADASNLSLVPVTISNPRGRQTPRHLNALFVEESESESVAILDKTNTQFNAWHLNLEPGLMVSTDSKKYSVKLVSSTSYPKYPILVLEFIQDEDKDSELNQLKNRLLTKYGISCS